MRRGRKELSRQKEFSNTEEKVAKAELPDTHT